MGEIITAIIMKAVDIIVAIVGTIFNPAKPLKAKKDKSGKYKLPMPFPCASCNVEDVAEIYDENRLEFDFAPNAHRTIIPEFVSMVFQFKRPVRLTNMKILKFDLNFGKGNFTNIDVEIKSNENSHQEIWKKSFTREKGWNTYTIDLTQNKLKDILKSTKEICFVVWYRYFPDTGHVDGDFAVKNITFE